MKIAILLSGVLGTANKFGTDEDLDYSISYKHFKKHILDANPEHEIDVFAHSWSVEHEKGVCDLYKPKKHLFEDQILFDFEYTIGDYNRTGPRYRADRGEYYGTYRGMDSLRFHSMFSKWYSVHAVNELKKQYEEENDFKYDFVMTTRYDLAYMKDVKFSDYYKDFFYLLGPDGGHEKGCNDLWFFSNSEAIDLFSRMYHFVSKMKYFPDKYTHNHFLCRVYLTQTGIANKVRLLWERPWSGPNSKTGPSPLVRDHYKLDVKSKRSFVKNDYNDYASDASNRVREKVMKNLKKTITRD